MSTLVLGLAVIISLLIIVLVALHKNESIVLVYLKHLGGLYIEPKTDKTEKDKPSETE